MISVIITGHGKFATGLKSSLELIIGEQPQLKAVDFLEEDSTDDLVEKLNTAISELEGEGIVFFTDVLGGSPFKTSVLVSQGMNNREVIAGTNSPMILDILFNRSALSAKEIKDKAITAAKNGIKSFENKKKRDSSKNSNGGI